MIYYDPPLVQAPFFRLWGIAVLRNEAGHALRVEEVQGSSRVKGLLLGGTRD